MIVYIDVGNTNITIGLYEKETLIDSYRLTTKLRHTSDEYGFMIASFLHESHLRVQEVEHVVISSVVPQIMHSFTNAIRKYLHKEPFLISSSTPTGIDIQIPNPTSLGTDRLVDMAGAYYEYGGPLIVVDFGTATTFDYVDEDGVFSFGYITLGLETSATTLSSQAAKLPEFEIKVPKSKYATDTSSAMQNGVLYGYIGQTEYLIQQMKDLVKKEVTVVATGGMGRLISELSTSIDIYDSELIFKGLRHIMKKNNFNK